MFVFLDFFTTFVRCFCYLDNAKIQPLELYPITFSELLIVTTSFRVILNKVIVYNLLSFRIML